MSHAIFCTFLFMSFPPYLKAQKAYGFEFQDNEVPKYLTNENGVAETRTKVGWLDCKGKN